MANPIGGTGKRGAKAYTDADKSTFPAIGHEGVLSLSHVADDTAHIVLRVDVRVVLEQKHSHVLVAVTASPD